MQISDPNCGAFRNKNRRGFFFFSAGAEKDVNNNRSFCDRRPSCRQQHVRNTPHMMSPVFFWCGFFQSAITSSPPSHVVFFSHGVEFESLVWRFKCRECHLPPYETGLCPCKIIDSREGRVWGGVIIDKQRGMYWKGVCGRVKKSFASALAPQAAC